MGESPKKLMMGATLVFVDESGFSLTPTVTKTWSPIGMTPILLHPFGHWEKLSAISGVVLNLRGDDLRTEMYFRLHPRRTIRNKQVADYPADCAKLLMAEAPSRGRGEG